MPTMRIAACPLRNRTTFHKQKGTTLQHHGQPIPGERHPASSTLMWSSVPTFFTMGAQSSLFLLKRIRCCRQPWKNKKVSERNLKQKQPFLFGKALPFKLQANKRRKATGEGARTHGRAALHARASCTAQSARQSELHSTLVALHAREGRGTASNRTSYFTPSLAELHVSRRGWTCTGPHRR